jgi:hypothetical protein
MCLLVLALTGSTNAQVFISEYVEGSLTNRALEIYNGSGAAIDLFTDGYRVVFYYSGAVTPSRTIQLTGTVSSGGTYVLAHQNSDAEILARANQLDGGGFFDGDDAVQLVSNAGALDVIGQIGVDPGTEWGTGLVSTRDNTICRKSGVLTGDPDGSDAFDPALEWDGFDQDSFTNLGDHTVGPLPVELTSFTAVTKDGDVWLRWRTQSETGNAGFEIQEVTAGGYLMSVVSFVEGAGTVTRAREYKYRIWNVSAGRHHYRLVQVDSDGSYEYAGQVEVDVIPDRYGLISAFPNPFNPATRIVYGISVSGDVRLSVMDVGGREVATLISGYSEAGTHEVTFDASGLASGIYLVRLETASEWHRLKIALIN